MIGAFLPLSPTYLIHPTIANRWYFKLPLMFLRHKVVDTNNPLAIKALVGARRRRTSGGDLSRRPDHSDRQPDEDL